MPTVTVIMIFLDADSFIEEAIESVFSQSYTDWELLLVDDGSRDNSQQLAMQAVGRKPDQVRLLCHPGRQNLGMSASRNLALAQAKGEYITFLDADDVWLPDMLSSYVTAIQSYPEVGMIYGQTTYWYSWNRSDKKLSDDFTPRPGVTMGHAYQPPELLERYLANLSAVPTMCSIIIRRHLLEAVNGFAEEFRGLYEDQVFHAKVAMATKIMPIDSNEALYRQHPSSTVATARSNGTEKEGRLRYLKWLKRFIGSHQNQTPHLIRLIERNIWYSQLVSNSSMSPLFVEKLRFVNKWLVRLETSLMPSGIRQRYWKYVLGIESS